MGFAPSGDPKQMTECIAHKRRVLENGHQVNRQQCFGSRYCGGLFFPARLFGRFELAAEIGQQPLAACG
jgi:hypothetical protein